MQKLTIKKELGFSEDVIRLLKYYIIGSVIIFISTFVLYLFVEQDPPKGVVIIEVSIDDQSTN